MLLKPQNENDMKRFLLLFLALFSSYLSYAQWWAEAYMTEEEKRIDNKTKDDAYSAPNNTFVGKKWYKDEYDYYIFNSNGTGAHVEVFIGKFEDVTYDRIITKVFSWKRNKSRMTLTWQFEQFTVKPDVASISKLSPRVQDEIKRINATTQSSYRKDLLNGTYYRHKRTIEYHIDKLTSDIMLLSYEETIYNPIARMYGKDTDIIHVLSKKKLDEIYTRKYKVAEDQATRKAEDQATRKEEDQVTRKEEEQTAREREEHSAREIAFQAAREREEQERMKKKETASLLRSRASSYMRQEQFVEAVNTIDKAIELLPDYADNYVCKGEILYMKGDKDGAKNMWEMAISLDPKIADPGRKSVLNWLINKKGWHSVSEVFPDNVPFKRIRVLKQKWGIRQDCCAFFCPIPPVNEKTDTDIFVQFFEQKIFMGSSNIKFKKCTEVGDGWIEYEFSQPVYFSHYQHNAPKDRLMILIE